MAGTMPGRTNDMATKPTFTTFSQLNFSTSNYRKTSWSSDEDSEDGGVMVSLRPLNHQATSLVSQHQDKNNNNNNNNNNATRQDSAQLVRPYPSRPNLVRSNSIRPYNAGVASVSALGDDLGTQDLQRLRIDGLPNVRVLRNSLRNFSPGIQRAAQPSPGPHCSTPLHFHQKPHHGQHEYHQSLTPGPFTCTKTRKYKLLHVPDIAPRRTQQAESNINDLVNGLETLTLQCPAATSWVYSPEDALVVLGQWRYDKEWMQRAETLEARDPFQGIDMNEGWNRDAANLIVSTRDSEWALPCGDGGPESKMKIKEMMNRFSFWTQLEPIEWDVEELKGMFDVVFVGARLRNAGWARKPGSWWATRKKLFDGHRGRSFLEELDLWVEEIEDGREKWKKENNGKLFAIDNLKRKASSANAQVDIEGEKRRKRVKLPKTKSEQVMSEEWRARRRAQEKKAGRWTDGTLLMDRMWEEFYWVLNGDDPRDEPWPREVFTRSYY